MIAAIAALGLTNVAFAITLAIQAKENRIERQSLTAAALQANDLPDAARRVDHAAEKRRADAHMKMVSEIRENGGVFTPPETNKPVGI